VSGAEDLRNAFEALGPSLHRAAACEATILAEPGSAEVVRSWRKHLPRSIEAAAAAALILLGVLSLVLFGNLNRLKEEVNALRRENSALRDQLPALQAELEQLRQARDDLLSSGANISIALNDAGGLVALDKSGDLIGLGTLSSAQERLVKTALTTGRIVTPAWLAGSRAPDDAIMGGSDQNSLRLLAPVGTATRTDRPAFRWTPLEGAVSYTVTISDSNFNQVATSATLTATEWTPPRPLTRGALYTWEVTALKDAKEVTAPLPPAREATFRVLERAKLAELEQAERANSHLLSGLAYAAVGLLDDAQREFQALADANPGSALAPRLLASVKAARSSRNLKR
jgi:hypothetical protein